MQRKPILDSLLSHVHELDTLDCLRNIWSVEYLKVSSLEFGAVVIVLAVLDIALDDDISGGDHHFRTHSRLVMFGQDSSDGGIKLNSGSAVTLGLNSGDGCNLRVAGVKRGRGDVNVSVGRPLGRNISGDCQALGRLQKKQKKG